MSSRECALKYFDSGFNCAQSVFAAFAEKLGLDTETALKVSSCFGGGMGRMAGTCGAVTGAFMVIGMKYGKYLIEDNQSKEKSYALVREFAENFKAKNGSIVCKELLGHDISTPEGAKAARESGVFVDLCPRFVADAVKVLEDILAL